MLKTKDDKMDKTNYSIIFFTAKEMKKKFPILINQKNWKEIQRIVFTLCCVNWTGKCYDFYVAKAEEALKSQNGSEIMALVDMLEAFVKKAKASEDEKLFVMINSWNAIK